MDPVQIDQLLANLCANARDAIAGAGTITISTDAVTVAATEAPDPSGGPPGDYIRLSIADTGCGMDPETLAHIFEPFFTRKGFGKGTGLGLAMVYGTVQRHDGTIEIDSEPGRGTIMRLVLPARENVTAPDASLPVEIPRPQQLRVLFVDDEPLLRELIRDILETDGHEVLTADGGVEALETFGRLLLEGRGPDVVITDLGMPRMDGRELTRRLKTQSPETPVIMMTGWGKMMRGQDDIRAPVDAVVSKPPRMAELQQALQQVVRPG
jgi:CheY-like chemotaxis protein